MASLAETFVTKSYEKKGRKVMVDKKKEGKKSYSLSRPSKTAKLTSKYAKPKSNLESKSKMGVTQAKARKVATDILTGIPGIQNRNSAANRNLRKRATKDVQKAKAEQAARSAGNTARSQMAVTRSRRKGK